MYNRKRGKTLEQRRRQAGRDKKQQKAIAKRGPGAHESLPINKPETGSRRSGGIKLGAKTAKKQRLLNKRKGTGTPKKASATVKGFQGTAAMDI